MPVINVSNASQRQMLLDLLAGLPDATRTNIGGLMDDLNLDFVAIERLPN